MLNIIKKRRRWIASLVSTLLLLGVTAQAELQDGLVAYWAFDENYDDSVGVFHGEPRGTEPIIFVDSVANFGKAIRLNGDDQFVEIVGGDENDLEFPGGDMSISGWFRVETFDTNWQCLISKGEGTNYRVARRRDEGSIAYAGGVGEPAAAAPSVTDGEWHHFVAISDSSTGTQLWIDGTLAESRNDAPTLGESNLPLMIGENPGARNREWEGDIDDIAIWNRILTESEIGQLANNTVGEALGLTKAPIAEGLVAHWNFDENYNDNVGGFTGEPRGTEPIIFVDSVANFGKAIRLNGDDQFVEIVGGDENDLEFPGGDMSISGWFRVETFDTNWQCLISKGEGNNYRVARRRDEGSIAYAGGVGEPGAAAPNVTDGEWHHFVAISDSSTGTQLWIDGTLAESRNDPPTLAQSNLPLMIGENPGARNREWEGDIDDIGIWNRILTESEIGQLANNPIDSIISPAQKALFSGLASRPNGFTIKLSDSPDSVVQADSVKLIIDGTEAADGSVTVVKDGSVTVITFSNAPDFFPSGSEHSVIIEYTDSAGGTPSIERPFTTPIYVSVNPSSIAEGVDTGKGGFRVFANQTASAAANRIFWSEQALRGEHGANIADMTSGPDLDRDGFGDPGSGANGFIDPSVINYDATGGSGAGDFQDPDFADLILSDAAAPGILSALAGGSQDNTQHEIITYIDFPTRDIYTMGVTSDDGFKVSIAGSNRDVLGQVLGFFDGDRGASPTLFSFLIEEPGIYPVRLLWYNGGGGSNVEWYSVRSDDVKVLINDLATEGALSSYYNKSGGERARVTAASGLNALLSGGSMNPDQTFEITLEDGTTSVDEASISFTFNGSSDGVTVNKSGSTTTVSFAPEGLLPAGQEVSIDFSWSEVGGASTSARFSATVSDFKTIESFRTALGTGGTPGFSWRVHQQAAGRANSTTAAEAQLAGGVENIADLSLADNGDIFFIDNWINFDELAASRGNFRTDSGIANQQVFDELIPGIPGLTDSTDNIAAEVITFVEFPKAALYQMVVNSDDGFRVTLATDETTADGTEESLTSADALELGVFDGGRGAADTVFFFAVNEPGIYPLRLLWYEGGGGANIEWFTVNSDGSRALINGNQPGALKAYRTRSGTPTDFVAPPEPIADPVFVTELWDFNDGLPTGSEVAGDSEHSATEGVDGSGALVITRALGGQLGGWLSGPIGTVESIHIDFDILIDGGTATQADGISLALSDDLEPVETFGENGRGSKLRINFDNWDNGGGEAPAIDIVWADTLIATAPMGTQEASTLDTDGWWPVHIEVTANGDITVTYNGDLIHDNVNIPGWAPIGNARLAFGGRTGGANANQWIDNLEYTTNPPEPFGLHPVEPEPEPEPLPVLGEGLVAADGGLTRVAWNGPNVDLTFYPEEFRGHFRFDTITLEPRQDSEGNFVSYFETPNSGDINVAPESDVFNDYAVVLYGFIHPPETGAYRFSIAADDFAELHISTDEDPMNSVLIALEPGWNPVRTFGSTARRPNLENLSDTLHPDGIQLVAGQKYYVEAIMKEAGGGDNIAVAWKGPGDDSAFVDDGLPISGDFLSGFVPPVPGTLYVEAEDFDFDGGSWVAGGDTGLSGPYAGNAYDGLGGVQGIDFDGAGSTRAYRTTDDPAPSIDKLSGPEDVRNARDGFIVESNWIMGWNDAGDWVNYTRDFPHGSYWIIGDFSSGGEDTSAQLDRVVEGAGTDAQTLEKLGEFNGAATGNWDVFAPIQLADDSGNPAVIGLGGVTTLRVSFLPGNADLNFLKFVPKQALYIEAEDFDFDGGSWIAGGTGFDGPYAGNAYNGLGGTQGIDFDGAGSTRDYRTTGDPGPSVDKESAPGDVRNVRDGFELESNWILGWNDPGDWTNYTRDFPEDNYEVVGMFSSGGSDISAQLDIVVDGAGTDSQTLEKLGEFNGAATGNWDVFAPIQLRDDSGNPAVVSLAGVQTLRITTLPGNLDWNFIKFFPSVRGGGGSGPGESISISTDADGNVVITWTGLLQSATDVTGPWTDVGDDSASPLTLPTDEARLFGRAVAP